MKKHENSFAQQPHKVPLRIHRVRTLSLGGLTLNRHDPQSAGHPTDGYALAMLTKDVERECSLVHHPLEPDGEGNYNLESVPEKSILMWTPIDGTAPDYGAVVEIRPYELVYVPADSPEHAWEILDFDQA